MDLIKLLYRKSWRLVLFATCAATISGLVSAALMALLNEGMNGSRPVTSLIVAFFFLCLLNLITKSFAAFSLASLGQTAVFRLRASLSRKLLATPQKKLQSLGKHRLLAILTEDVHTVTQACEWFPVGLGSGVVIVACIAYLAWLSWQMAAVLIIGLVPTLIAVHLAERRPAQNLAGVREKLDMLYKHLRHLIDGSKELQLNVKRGNGFIECVIEPCASELKHRTRKAIGGYIVLINVSTAVYFSFIGILVFVVPYWLPQRTEVLTAVVLTLLYLMGPINEVMNALPLVRQTSIALKKIQQLDEALSPAESKPALDDPFACNNPLVLELKGVCHRYKGKEEKSSFMLGPIDFAIQRGEIVFITGGNGSGKTTLAMLLLGLYEPDAGAILLNKTIVTNANRETYRQYFSAVFADFHLFEYLYFVDDDDELDDELRAAQAASYMQLLGIAHKVDVVRGRVSTTDLSTGQRKRLALTSAYLEDRPIYLFDEWAADQDSGFKRLFYTKLLPELKARGKAVIAITHDDAYLSYADRIVEMVDGTLRISAHTSAAA